MTNLIEKAIRNHIAYSVKEREELEFNKYAKGFKLLKVDFNKTFENSDCIAELEATTTFKAKKFDNNRAKWIVAIYKDGSTQVYFNGEDYAIIL